MRNRRKIFYWLAVCSGIVIILLLSLNHLIPRLINSELIKGEIEDIISQRVGGEVSFKSVDLTVFPLLQATLKQGNISTESVSGSIYSFSFYPEVLQLLRGRLVETKIIIISPDIIIDLSSLKKPEAQEPVSAELITSLLSSRFFGYKGKVFVLRNGNINFLKKNDSFIELKGLDVRVYFQPNGQNEIKADLESSFIKLSTRIDDKETEIISSKLRGGVHYDHNKTSVLILEMVFDSPDFTLSGELGIDNKSKLINLSVEGKELDVKSVRETVIKIAGGAPEIHKVFQFIKEGHIPSITLSSQAGSFTEVVKEKNIIVTGSISEGEILVPETGIHLWNVNADSFFYDRSGLRLKNIRGSAGKSPLIENPPQVSMDIIKDNDEFRITDLTVRDEATDAVFDLGIKEKILEVSFTGQLSQTTLDKIFSKNISQSGLINGEIRGRVHLDKPLQSVFEGAIHGEDMLFNPRSWGPVKLKTISLDAEDNNLKIENVRIELRDKIFSMKGDVKASEDAILFDMDISTDGIEWESISEVFDQKGDGEGDGKVWDIPYKGSVIFDAGYFTYEGIRVKPFRADVSLEPDIIDIVVNDADICGISLPAKLYTSSGEQSVKLQPVAVNQELDPVLNCLWGKGKHITGNFDIKGEFNARGRGEPLLNSLQGDLEFTARDGMIQQNILLSRLFALLNPSIIFNGELPDLAKEGFPYKTITAEAALDNNNLLIKEVSIEGISMTIGGHGSINLKNNELDMDILVSPWKTPDKIIEKLPLIRDIVPESILSMPVKATGSYDDPEVMYFSPAMVGSRLLEIMEKTLTSPVRVIDPSLLDENKE